MPDSLSEQVSKQFSERRARIHTNRLVPWPLLVSADRQETLPISVKVEFDKTRARRELGACSPSLYTVAGKNVPFFFNQMEGKEVKTRITTRFRLELHSGRRRTLTQSLILEDRTRGEDLRCHRPKASQDPALLGATPQTGKNQELSSSSPQPSHTHTSSDRPEDVPAGEAPFIGAAEERRYLKRNVTRSMQHLGDENLKHSKRT